MLWYYDVRMVMDLNEDEMELKRIGFIVSDYKPELLHGDLVTGRRDMGEENEDRMGLLLLIIQHSSLLNFSDLMKTSTLNITVNSKTIIAITYCLDSLTFVQRHKYYIHPILWFQVFISLIVDLITAISWELNWDCIKIRWFSSIHFSDCWLDYCHILRAQLRLHQNKVIFQYSFLWLLTWLLPYLESSTKIASK